MSEELEKTENDGTWSSLKKTLVGVIGTIVTAGGVYVTTLFGGGKEESAPVPVQAPAPVINITNSNQQQTSGGTTVIVKEVPSKETKKEKPKKDGDEFKQTEPKW